MTRPHPVEGKPRTRKPETVLRELEVTLSRFSLVAFYRVDDLIRELRRSLRDTRGTK